MKNFYTPSQISFFQIPAGTRWLLRVTTVLLLLVLAGNLSLYAQTTVTLTSSKVSLVFRPSPTLNWGNDDVTQVQMASTGTDPRTRPLVEFDLSSIPTGATITGATFRIVKSTVALCGESNVSLGNSMNVQLRRLTRSWVEGTACSASQSGSVSWNSAGSTNWTTPGGDFATTNYGSFVANPADAGNTAYTVNVLSLLDYWRSNANSNFGILLLPTTGTTSGSSSVNFFADEGAPAGSAPQLIVTYTLPPPPFITQWSFPTATTQIRFNALTAGGAVNYTWSASPSGNSGSGSFTQTTAGLVTLSGLNIAAGDVVTLSMEPQNLRRFYNGTTNPDRLRLTDVTQWGDVPWSSMESAFQSTNIFTFSATDVPNLSGVTSMANMLAFNAQFSGSNIGTWDVSAVTNMSGMFNGANSFGGDLSSWDVSSVTNMSSMFAFSTGNNIGGWDVSSVTNMSSMFFGGNVSGSILGWDVSAVTDMSGMFALTGFNQNIGSWVVSAVTNMSSMFRDNPNFNQNIGGWDVAAVTNMSRMFESATAFNWDISGWDVAAVTDMSNMFNTTAFNQNIGAWILNPAVNMSGMLSNNNINCENYSSTLIGWVSNNPTVTGRTLGASGRQYGTNAVAARNTLTTTRGWTISGDSPSGVLCGTDPCISLSAVVSSQTNVSCFGGSTGAVTVEGSGGVAPYTYSLDGGGFVSSGTFTGLTAGNKVVTVRDNVGCERTVSATITEPDRLRANVIFTDVTCFGAADGSITASSPTGGSGVYEYRIDSTPWQSSGSFTGLAANPLAVLTLQIRDANATTCVRFLSSSVIREPAQLVVTPTLVQPSCFAGGSISLTVSGGISPYTYDWSDLAGTSNPKDRSSLAAGTYTVTVTDANGCTVSSGNIVLNAPTGCGGIDVCQTSPAEVFSVAPDPANISYTWTVPAGAVIVSGQGTPEIRVNWNAVAEGSYQVCVVAVNDCDESAQTCIDVNVFAPVAVATAPPVICAGSTFNLFASGGTSYSWTGPNGFTSTSANPTIPNANAATHNGTYTVTVTNSVGCSATASVTVTVDPVPVASITSITDASCGQTNGSVDISVSGGTPAYTYLWSNGATTEDISNVSSGTYTVTVTDSKGCTVQRAASVSSVAGPAISFTKNDVDCFGGNDGSIDITPSGGTAPYTYLWSNGATTQDISGLTAGTYSVTVTDATGCVGSISVTITQGSEIILDHTKVDVNCFGGLTGSINLSVSGGTSPYTYAWTRNGTPFPQPIQDPSSIPSGTYVVTVTDANGCTATETVVITSPAAALSATAAITNINCRGASTGQIILTPTGGTAPYTFAWTGPNSFTATTKDLIKRPAGTYNVTITDANGCVFQLNNLLITQPASNVAVAPGTITNVECFGDADGSVSINVSGGTAPYTYGWNTGATTQNLTGLNLGNYVVVVTDANGCSVVSNVFTVTGPTAPLAAFITQTPASCFGASDGQVSMVNSGGTAPYTYLWSNGVTTQNLQNITAGVYTVEVTDANLCKATFLVDVEQPAEIFITGAITNALCTGSATGGIDVSIIGGTTPLSYQWNDGPTTEDRSLLTAGSYTITVTDNSGCSASKTFVVNNTSALTVNSILTPVTCFGDNNGRINLIVTGGIGPTTFAWSNGATTEDLTGLAPGTYSVNVSDDIGCVRNLTGLVITQPAVLAATAVAEQNVSCKGGNNGRATANVTGGTTPYTYLWSNGATTQTANNLVAGTYNVLVIDANGCTINSQVTITEPATEIELFATSIAASSCGGSTGSINLTVLNANAPPTFVWTGPTAIGNIEDPTNLAAGVYNVTVTDNSGCSKSLSVTVGTAAAFSVTVELNPVSCAGLDGEVFAVTTGGVGPFTYQWSASANNATSSSVGGLGAGTYSVVVTDANGCTANASGALVAPVCLPPVAEDDAYETDLNTPFFGTVATNDSDPDNTLSELEWQTDGPIDPNSGTIEFNPDGTFTFTPANNFVGVVTQPYLVCDPGGLCDGAILTITVGGLPPIAVNDIAVTPINTPVTANVLTNDSDPEGGVLVVTTTPISNPTNGTVVLQSNGLYTYTPNTGFVGEDTFCYSITDVQGLKDTACVTIDVIPNPVLVNNPPVAVDDNTETPQNTPVLVVVKANDSDPDGDPLGLPTAVSAPTNGTVVYNPDGTVTYTPNPGFTGKDSFEYQVCDDGTPSLCDEATVTIVVKPTPDPGNQPPVAVDDAVLTLVNIPVSSTVAANDSDPDHLLSELTFTKLTDPSNGSVVQNSNGNFTYTPNTGFVGNDSYIYRVCDPLGACDTATVSIAILNPLRVSLRPKVWLQGALFGVSAANGLMRDDLRSKNLLPLISPYPAMNMPEVTPSAPTTSAVLGVATPVENSIVDWVYVELRDPADSTITLNTTSALIQRDGDIVGVDGVSAVTFGQAAAGNYYVVVRHRNHLGVMSATPIALSSVPAVVDFRDGSTVAYNLDDNNITNEPLVVVNQGLALWAGNALVDTRVIYQGNSNDVNPIFNSVLGDAGNIFDSPFYKLKTYNLGDINMNGETVFQGSGNDLEFIYLNVIQNHPGNILKQNFFIIKQQLP